MENFFDRMKDYLSNVAKVLKGEAESSSIFPNSTDIGSSREKIYAKFLTNHVPSCCNTIFGGFLFDDLGNESKQIDIIVYNSLCPQYNFHNSNGAGKSFTSIDGTIAVVSVKSTLNSSELENALENIASLPNKKAYDKVGNKLIKFDGYEDWPYKILYANSGISMDAAKLAVENYYKKHHEIPIHKRINQIHVSGNYVGLRVYPGGTLSDGTILDANSYWFCNYSDPDVQALCTAMYSIQKIALASQQLFYNYDEIYEGILNSCIKNN
jgi:hypothetical protein